MVRKLYITEDTGSVDKFLMALEDRIDELENEEMFGEAVEKEIEESAFITSKDKELILNIFDLYDVVVLKQYMKDEVYEGNLYHNFVVETDDMSRTALKDVEDALRELEETAEIGYENNYNSNGRNARTFYFYKFIN